MPPVRSSIHTQWTHDKEILALNTGFCQGLWVIQNGILIEPWDFTDREGAISVVQEVFKEYSFSWEPAGYHSDLYDVPGHYLEKGHCFFVARKEDQVVGTAALEVFTQIPGPYGSLTEFEGNVRISGTDCSLERLYVRPDFRGMGVGSALLERIIQTARTKERSELEIWSDKLFHAAHRLYAKFGAEIVGDRVGNDPDQSQEWGLKILLAPWPTVNPPKEI